MGRRQQFSSIGGENIKSEYINPFIQGTTEVINNVVGVKLETKGTSLANSPIKSKGTVVQIGVVGDLKGNMLANMNNKTKNLMVKAMFGGMSIEGQDEEMLNSATGELFNMVIGDVSTKFESIGVNVDISPPNVISGEETEVSVTNSPMIKLTLGGEELNLDLMISIK